MLQNKNKLAATNQKKNQSEDSGDACIAENCHNEELLVISDGDSQPYDDWILDLACMFHICLN